MNEKEFDSKPARNWTKLGREKSLPSVSLRIEGAVGRITDSTVSIVLLRNWLLMSTLVAVLLALPNMRGNERKIFNCDPRSRKIAQIFRSTKSRLMVSNAKEVLANHLNEKRSEREEGACYQKLRRFLLETSARRLPRRYAIDELPQFINEIGGERSTVVLRLYSPTRLDDFRFEALFAIEPSLTGLSQPRSRNAYAFSTHAQIDRTYVRARSLTLDIELALVTILVFLSGSGY